MKRAVRIALLLSAILAALAFAGGALAAYTPKLVVSHDPLAPQGGARGGAPRQLQDHGLPAVAVHPAVGGRRDAGREARQCDAPPEQHIRPAGSERRVPLDTHRHAVDRGYRDSEPRRDGAGPRV